MLLIYLIYWFRSNCRLVIWSKTKCYYLTNTISFFNYFHLQSWWKMLRYYKIALLQYLNIIFVLNVSCHCLTVIRNSDIFFIAVTTFQCYNRLVYRQKSIFTIVEKKFTIVVKCFCWEKTLKTLLTSNYVIHLTPSLN